MERMPYQPHEARRHADSIKETLQLACRTVFTEPSVGFRLKDAPWFFGAPAERVTINVFQKTGCCHRNPICTIAIDRPKSPAGLFEYTQASAVFHDRTQHAGNTRLVGHLQRQCPFLPKIEATMAYDPQEQAQPPGN